MPNTNRSDAYALMVRLHTEYGMSASEALRQAIIRFGLTVEESEKLLAIFMENGADPNYYDERPQTSVAEEYGGDGEDAYFI